MVWILLQPIDQVGPAAEPERAGKNMSVQAASNKNWIPERQQQQQKEAPGRAKGGRHEMEISAPFNFHHNVHVRVSEKKNYSYFS